MHCAIIELYVIKNCHWKKQYVFLASIVNDIYALLLGIEELGEKQNSLASGEKRQGIELEISASVYLWIESVGRK